MTKIQSTIDPSKLLITDDPYTEVRPAPPSKYEAVFSALNAGQRIVCPEGAASKIAGQLKKWLIAHGHKAPIVRARERCKDGKGGVWWMQEALTPATVWQTENKQAPKLKRAA